MDNITPGIVLHTYPYSETSLVVRWLTPDHGRLSTLARGARRPKSPFRGKIDLFYHCQFNFARSRRSQLHTLRELRLVNAHPNLRRDLRALELAAYAAKLLEGTTETDTPLPNLFNLLAGLLDHLDHQSPTAAALFACEFAVLADLGLSPPLTGPLLSVGTRPMARALAQSRWNQLRFPDLSARQNGELDRFLGRFLAEHVGHVLPSRARTLQALRHDSESVGAPS